jgi:hypothetical protein
MTYTPTTLEETIDSLLDIGYDIVAERLLDAVTDPAGTEAYGWCDELHAVRECAELIANPTVELALRIVSRPPVQRTTLPDAGRPSPWPRTQLQRIKNVPRSTKHRRGQQAARFVR